MENIRPLLLCSTCETLLKRQVIGSNVFYYCRNCGRTSSAGRLTPDPEAPLISGQVPAAVNLQSSEVHQEVSAP